jgi:leucyl-tRNA synthetase
MSTARRDVLTDIETRMQQKWEAEKTHEADAPASGTAAAEQPKYFITFPYPYMNGKLHLGHCFSLTKSEFAARFYRMKGRKVLWPFGLHVTGTPIAACAQKIQTEMAKFGNPPQFPDEYFAERTNAAEEKAKEAAAAGQHKSKRGKAGPPKPQWHIMKDMGLSDAEIPSFAESRHWLNHFPALAVADLKKLGCHIDWRRSFITTEVNPFYDSFVKWQFGKLREAGYLNFGKRYSVYSPLDGQPCADHDRASGEGVLPQEYTIVKLKVQNPSTVEAFAPYMNIIGARDVILPGATLRPETVVGQTNCWISPNFAYKAFAVKNAAGQEEVFLMTHKAARNMLYQNFTVNGTIATSDVEPLFEIDGALLIGLPLTAPMSRFPTIYTLPMATISESKGTGVVMSVPADSPDDYINFTQLIKKPEYRAKLGIKDEWVVPFEIIPIIEVPGELGRESARIVCEKLKINGPKDADLLEEAKKIVYQAGFYQGTMIEGPYTGEKVSVAKVKMTKELMDQDLAIRYFEPTKQVMSRSGDECVVALCDQWFIEYGKQEWKQAVVDHVKGMNLYFPGIRNGFEETLDWLADWPCSRTFGLGTKLPCDASQSMIIDSLSDSTIYMAYYTVAQFFHIAEDGSLCLDGSKPNRYGIAPSMITNAVWDFALKGVGSAESVHAATGLPVDIANAMRNEFSYWYPVDLRVSAKDLIQNHLTMFLYNHAAIWPEDRSKWPQSIYCNGHIQVDNEKMSKSKGNFISLSEAVTTYGADATRMACADAGDSLDDANFVRESAAGFIMKLTTLIETAKDSFAKKDILRAGAFNTFDKIFENSLNAIIITTENYFKGMAYRMALNSTFYELANEYSSYKMSCDDAQMHSDLVRRYYEVTTLMLMPLAPHFAEYMWGEVLGNEGSVMNQTFPAPSAPVNFQMQVASRVFNDVVKEIRAQVTKNAKKRGPIDELYVYVAQDYNAWQKKALATLTTIFAENNNSFPADTTKMIIARKEEWMTKDLIQDAMAFIAFVKANTDKYGSDALSATPVVNDLTMLNEVLPSITKLSGVATIHVLDNSDESVAEHKVARSKARPGEPNVTFPPLAKK